METAHSTLPSILWRVPSLEQRRLVWGQCQNARDLGGLPTQDGGIILPLALIRTDSHERLGDQGMQALRESGVKRIIDLRSTFEAERRPSPFKGMPEYLNVTLFDERDEEGRRMAQAATTVQEMYQVMLDRYPHHNVEALTAIATAPEGGVVVHCWAGKDRTGIITALALHVAGVAEEEIAEDYALTDQCLSQHYADEAAAIADESMREKMRSFQHTKPETLLGTFGHLKVKYGSVDNYLAQAGLTEETRGLLRDRLRQQAKHSPTIASVPNRVGP